MANLTIGDITDDMSPTLLPDSDDNSAQQQQRTSTHAKNMPLLTTSNNEITGTNKTGVDLFLRIEKSHVKFFASVKVKLPVKNSHEVTEEVHAVVLQKSMSKRPTAEDSQIPGKDYHSSPADEPGVELQLCHKSTLKNCEGAQASNRQNELVTPETHKCDLCSKNFRYQSLLQFHLKWHNRDDSTKCQVCHKFFATMKGLVIHMRNHTGERPYKCEFCQRGFTASNYLLIHRRIHTGEKPYSCKECPLRFRQKTSYLFHMRKHTGNLFVCEHCGKKFVYPRSFKDHQNMHTGGRPFVCNECGLSFIGCNGLMTHMKKHKDKDWVPKTYRKGESCNRPFECSLCGSSFVTQAHLEGHLTKHNGLTLEVLKTFKRCDVCKRKFTSDQSLMHHIKKNHPEARPFDFLELGKSTIEETPKKSKMPEKPFICRFCDKGLSQKGDLKCNERTDTGVKPYKCTECNKTFGRGGNLNSHMRIHTGEKPYKCTECDKTFGQRGSLSSDIANHTGEKSYVCKVCGRAFRQKGPLDAHLMLQTDSKPHTCKVCGNSFVTKYRLQAHELRHYPKNVQKKIIKSQKMRKTF